MRDLNLLENDSYVYSSDCSVVISVKTAIHLEMHVTQFKINRDVLLNNAIVCDYERTSHNIHILNRAIHGYSKAHVSSRGVKRENPL